MTPSHRTTAAAVLVLALAAPLSGCATPFGHDDPSTSRSVSSSPADSGAGRQLTDEEAKASLPTRPKGARNTSTKSTSEGRTTDPKECLDVLRLGPEDEALREVRVANVARGWSTQDPATSYTFRVESYSRPVGPTLLDRAGAAMGSCGAFSLMGGDDDGHFDLRVLAEPRTVSAIGEQNFAARIISFEQVDGKSSRVYLDYVVVRVGHNLVEVNSVHRDETRGIKQLETYAEGILHHLEE